MKPYYEDEWVTLYHGDCLEVDAWLAADVLITDPPYGMAFQSSWTTEKRPIVNDADTTARDAVLAAWGGRPWLMFGTWRVARPGTTRHLLVWNKAGAGPGMGDLGSQFGTSHEEIYLGGNWPKRTARRGSVITTNESPSALTTAIGHPTPKPEALMSGAGWGIIRHHRRPIRRLGLDPCRRESPGPQGDRRRDRRALLQDHRRPSRAGRPRLRRGIVTMHSAAIHGRIGATTKAAPGTARQRRLARGLTTQITGKE